MKKTVLTLLFLTSSLYSFSQKELWGVNTTESYIDYSNPAAPVTVPYLGNISKYDINGLNPTIVHEFTDFATGKTPKGKLFLASNGKLYGTTYAGGIIGPQGTATDNGLGVLYEYDLILDKYRVIYYFDIIYGGESIFGVIEPILGKLYGTFGIRIFSYDINTESITIINGLTGGRVNNELMKASNGFLYGTTGYVANCPGTTEILPNYGTIFRVNTTTNTVQTARNFNCNGSDGVNIGTNSGTLIEFQQGKLLGTVTSGLLFEFNTNTNIITQKINFAPNDPNGNNPNGYNLGNYPMMMVNNNNGKLYGVCQQGGTGIITINGIDYTTHSGTLFEYMPTTNTLNKLYDFPNGGMTDAGFPSSIMKASTGYYFGISNGGIYKFDSTNNTTISPCFPYTSCPTPAPNAGVTESLIEICRKPSYQEFIVNTFSPAIGSAFSFDVQNTNATSYIWKKGTIVLPTQTTGILNIASITSSDSGTYTCTMTNECGTTVTMPLQININLGIEEFIPLDKVITLFPNPTNNILNFKIYENSNVEISKITITNLLGQIVFSEEKNNNKIDVSKFQTGIYQIKLTTNKGNWSGKFIKE
jgi:hypothetical protein